jgi:hypothetical protein
MAKRKVEAKDEIMVMATKRFRHRAVYVNLGETLHMSRAEAADMVALGFVHAVEALTPSREPANG